jgi:hypothetical protein
LKQAGVTDTFEEEISSILRKGLPDFDSIPLLNRIKKGVQPWVHYLPYGMKNALQTVPSKLNTLIINLLLKAFGMYRTSSRFPSHCENLPQKTWKQLFTPSEWSQLFNKKSTRIYWTPLMTAWQKEQPSTQTFKYIKGNPQFNII